MQFNFNFVQQCIQISTRINSSSVHTYIFVCFIQNLFNNSTWCQNRGCSYISSTRRIYRSNPAVSCISPSILNTSTVDAIPTVPPSKQNGNSTPRTSRTPRHPRVSRRNTKGIPPPRLGLQE